MIIGYNDAGHGPNVYLNNGPTGLYFAGCGGKWVGYRQTTGMYVVALWFNANEHVKYQRLDFNKAQIVDTQTFIANGSGYLYLKFDTTKWNPDHQHLLFTGLSSGANYCGHFDLNSNTNAPLNEVHDAHTPAELQRINDILKASVGPSVAPLTLPSTTAQGRGEALAVTDESITIHITASASPVL